MITIEVKLPDASDYNRLRSAVGWPEIDEKRALLALQQSVLCAIASINNRCVGMVRIIGDGALFFYIQDLIVEPEFQGTGIGTDLMRQVEHFVDGLPAHSTVGLFAAKGKEEFYRQFGYSVRSGDPLGAGMCKFIADSQVK